MFWLLATLLTLHLDRSVMPKPVYLLTVQEAHKEYNSLTDLIRAKYEQLASGEFGVVGNPAFNAEACELANLLALIDICHSNHSMLSTMYTKDINIHLVHNV